MWGSVLFRGGTEKNHEGGESHPRFRLILFRMLYRNAPTQNETKCSTIERWWLIRTLRFWVHPQWPDGLLALNQFPSQHCGEPRENILSRIPLHGPLIKIPPKPAAEQHFPGESGVVVVVITWMSQIQSLLNLEDMGRRDSWRLTASLASLTCSGVIVQLPQLHEWINGSFQ